MSRIDEISVPPQEKEKCPILAYTSLDGIYRANGGMKVRNLVIARRAIAWTQASIFHQTILKRVSIQVRKCFLQPVD